MAEAEGLNLPESLNWQSVEAGKPEEPVFEGGAWPTMGMLQIMGEMRQKQAVGQELIDYCQTLPGGKQLSEVIDGYNIRFHGSDGDPEGWLETFANWLASEGEDDLQEFDKKPEREARVRKFMGGRTITRFDARQNFLRQVLNQLMPAGVKTV